MPVGTVLVLPVATETARAPFGLAGIADGAVPRLFGLTWGAEDLSTALGAATNQDEAGGLAFTYRMVRSMCLLAARAAAVGRSDGYADFRDIDGLRASSAAAAREGFTGRLAIDPGQVAIINAAFSPFEADVAHARRLVEAFAAAPGRGAVGLEGRMLDRPHLPQPAPATGTDRQRTARPPVGRGPCQPRAGGLCCRRAWPRKPPRPSRR